jgi:hypothetical protein
MADETPLPPFGPSGDLPVGIHHASLQAVIERFGQGTHQRALAGARLSRIYAVAASTGHLRRFIVFGSFITTKPEPNDVDVFLLMDDSSRVGDLAGEAKILFEHAAAEVRFGASVFWLRRQMALSSEVDAVEHWQVKRDGSRRGIIEIGSEAS